MTQGGYQVAIILPIKSKMAAARKRCFLRFLSVFYWIFTSVIQSPSFTNDYEFFISVSIYISVVDILLFIDCSKMARIRINTRFSYQRETVPDKFIFFQNWYGKKVNRVSKIHVCMCLRYVLKEFL